APAGSPVCDRSDHVVEPRAQSRRSPLAPNGALHRGRRGLIPMLHEIAFEMAVSSIRFGPGVTREVGMDLSDLGARNVLVLTDPVLRTLPPVQAVMDSLDANRVAATLYDRVRVEPSDDSFLDAIAFAKQGR